MDFCSKIHLFLEFVDRVENWNCCSSLPQSHRHHLHLLPFQCRGMNRHGTLTGQKVCWARGRIQGPTICSSHVNTFVYVLTGRTAASVWASAWSCVNRQGQLTGVGEGVSWHRQTGSPPTVRRCCQRDNSPSSPLGQRQGKWTVSESVT